MINGKQIVFPPFMLQESITGGIGVFAMVDIKKGTWLTEYGGEVISKDEASRRREMG